MQETSSLDYLKDVLENMPSEWLKLTTHSLDIYNESLAKTEFIEQFEDLYKSHNAQAEALRELPTAYDYIRLGHPLSCLLEWFIAKSNAEDSKNVISFSSRTAPILAILRKNSLEKKQTQICYIGELPKQFDSEVFRTAYGYSFDLKHVERAEEIPSFEGTQVLISQESELGNFELNSNIDFSIQLHQAKNAEEASLGSILIANSKAKNSSAVSLVEYVSEIQHVRRRETIAMTPADCLSLLYKLTHIESTEALKGSRKEDKSIVLDSIKSITGSNTKAVVSSSGLSIQYAIMMGLVHHAREKHPGKAIKFVVPPNCYGGTNDQARRVAACIEDVEVVDLPVDGDHDMVQSLEVVLTQIAQADAIPYIIAEIPTNPRVEVPNLTDLKAVLSLSRKTANGETAVEPVFILDQTFCPNVLFLGEGEILSTVQTISYVSGSKFPSGGNCTAGYCVGNKHTNAMMDKIELHLHLCDNEATDLQYSILAKQLPSMNQRIADAYQNTREFVNFIQDNLPGAKINFVSEELAEQGFTPSVFSLDLPTKGNSDEEREAYKRDLNLKLIDLMIGEIPNESKYCVSYGQLKGCYWTIPATSTQGTTKEGDKDYIARVALSPSMDLERHKKVFSDFVASI